MPFPLLFHRLLSFGRKSEILGLDYLRSLGYRVVASPYRIGRGEVDVIAWDGDVLVFVEVKARQSSEPGEDSVGFHKQRRIARAAQSYIARHRLQEKPHRFDILAVNVLPGAPPEFRLLRDAFDMYN
jgi:putative endonuclease